MFLKIASLLTLSISIASSSDIPMNRRHHLKTRLPKVRQKQVTSDLKGLLVEASVGPCGGPESTKNYEVGDMMQVCIFTDDPAIITAVTSVTATSSGEEVKELLDHVGDVNLGTTVEGIETSEVTLSTLITLKYYYDAVLTGNDPVITLDGKATVNGLEIGFKIDVPFGTDMDLASLGAGITTPAAKVICSCSPTVYLFTLDFSSKGCEENTINDNEGIDIMLCDSKNRSIDSVRSVQFLEFDTSGNLVVIKQDDRYYDTPLGYGDSFKFTSISSNLDTEVSLEDQLDLVPGGMQLTVKGVDKNGSDVMNRYTWSYTNSCADDAVTVEDGDYIAWVTIEPTPASSAFCPAVSGGFVHTTEAPDTTEIPDTSETNQSLVTTKATETTEAVGTTEAFEGTTSPDEDLSLSKAYSKSGKVSRDSDRRAGRNRLFSVSIRGIQR